MTFQRDREARNRVAENFMDRGVAEAYAYRPQYPRELLDFLVQIPEEHKMALDLGCGNGRITIFLASKFDEVVGLDPSPEMISQAEKLARKNSNIEWVLGKAEDYEAKTKFDLVVAGSSIHWTDQEILFPKLAKITDKTAIVSGDSLSEPPCGKEKWARFVAGWLSRLSEKDPERWKKYDPSGFGREANRHEKWMDIRDRRTFSQNIKLPVGHFIEMLHSQATWSRSSMGAVLSSQFDNGLKELLQPYSSNGSIVMEMESEVVWGAPRTYPKK